MAYIGFSESVRSREAKDSGIYPLSYWTKAVFLDAVEEDVDPAIFAAMKKTRWSGLRDHVLRYREWHHTSNMYNRTDFYGVDWDAIDGLTVERLAEINAAAREEAAAAKAAKAEPVTVRVRAHYLEWGGTRRHPKAKDVEEEGVIDGNWFISDSGVRKSTTARGFFVLETLEGK